MVHIGHKGPIDPPSNDNKHCLVVNDSSSRYIQVYPVSSTLATDTILAAHEKFFLTSDIPQKLVYDKGKAFMNEELTSCFNELGITNAPRTAYSQWINGKVEIQNRHPGIPFRIYLNQPIVTGVTNSRLLINQLQTPVQGLHTKRLFLAKSLNFRFL